MDWVEGKAEVEEIMAFVSSGLGLSVGRVSGRVCKVRRGSIRAQGEENGSGREEHNIPDGGRDWNAEWMRFKEGGMKSVSQPEPTEEVEKRKKQHSTRYQRERARAARQGQVREL